MLEIICEVTGFGASESRVGLVKATGQAERTEIEPTRGYEKCNKAKEKKQRACTPSILCGVIRFIYCF
jgi:hypothetical protein